LTSTGQAVDQKIARLGDLGENYGLPGGSVSARPRFSESHALERRLGSFPSSNSSTETNVVAAGQTLDLCPIEEVRTISGVRAAVARGRWMGRSLMLDIDGEMDAETMLLHATEIGRDIEDAVRAAVPEARRVRWIPAAPSRRSGPAHPLEA
jgi:hypothetical protein